MLSDSARTRAFNMIIMTQCLGMIAATLFQNGFYLNYFSTLGISSATIAFLFSLPALAGLLLMVPCAFYSDRMGKQKLAMVGQALNIGCFIFLMAASLQEGRMALLFVVSGLLLWSLGGTLQGSNWFALLNPIVPEAMRGRFFGRLRVTFQLVSVGFTLLITKALKVSSSMTVFLVLLGVVALAQGVRTYFYKQIPELENAGGEGRGKSLWLALREVLACSASRGFNCYLFLITLFTAACPMLFGLMEKDALGFTPAQISFQGVLFLLGGISGCWLGGRLVDRLGTRPVFVTAHISYGLILIFVVLRGLMPWSVGVHMSLCTFIFSLIAASAGVAVTTEILGLIPKANKSLSTAVSMSMINGGIALSSLLISRILEWRVLAESWQVRGLVLNEYDALLLGGACMILLLTVTLGLVPSVFRPVELVSE